MDSRCLLPANKHWYCSLWWASRTAYWEDQLVKLMLLKYVKESLIVLHSVFISAEIQMRLNGQTKYTV